MKWCVYILNYYCVSSEKPCSQYRTKCDDGIKCLHNAKFCDEKEDCSDGSDEKPELCQGMLKPEL